MAKRHHTFEEKVAAVTGRLLSEGVPFHEANERAHAIVGASVQKRTKREREQHRRITERANRLHRTMGR